jgi:hypothetical protein
MEFQGDRKTQLTALVMTMMIVGGAIFYAMTAA